MHEFSHPIQFLVPHDLADKLLNLNLELQFLKPLALVEAHSRSEESRKRPPLDIQNGFDLTDFRCANPQEPKSRAPPRFVR